MKNLITSVIFGFLIGIIYIAVMLLISSPLVLLVRMGFLLGDANMVVEQILGEPLLNFIDLGSSTIILIVVQIFLCLATFVITYIFISKVIDAFLSDKDESYFRTLYKILFLIAFIVPEILTVISIFIPVIPIKTILIVDSSIAGIIFMFTTFLVEKVLPDTMKFQNKKYLFGEKK